jgi:hypothetical protein
MRKMSAVNRMWMRKICLFGVEGALDPCFYLVPSAVLYIQNDPHPDPSLSAKPTK